MLHTVLNNGNEAVLRDRLAKDAEERPRIEGGRFRSRDDHDGNVSCGRVGCQFLLHVTAAETRQFDVEDDKIRCVGFDMSKRVDAVLERHDGVSADHYEHLTIEDSKVWIVLDDQDDPRPRPAIIREGMTSLTAEARLRRTRCG